MRPSPRREAFQQLVTSELNSLPEAVIGPGSLHRIIAQCQRKILALGLVVVGPSPRHDALDTTALRARRVRRA